MAEYIVVGLLSEDSFNHFCGVLCVFLVYVKVLINGSYLGVITVAIIRSLGVSNVPDMIPLMIDGEAPDAIHPNSIAVIGTFPSLPFTFQKTR